MSTSAERARSLSPAPQFKQGTEVSDRRNSDDNLIDTLRQKTIDVIRSAVPRDRPVALLDFPRYSNVGDSAIWLGEIHCLAACGMAARDIRYMCDVATYDEASLRDAVGNDGVILLNGGGNFGDLWAIHQQFREAVVAAFPNNPIVILPQSIHFREPGALERTAEIFNRHAQLTILVRDRLSFDLLQQHFSASSEMCPDMAFCIGSLERPVRPEQDVVYLARADQESQFSDDGGGFADIESVDWPETGAAQQWRIGNGIADFQVDHRTTARSLRAPLQFLTRASYHAMAKERLAVGSRLLARGRVVVTDRLHAHILALLLGIPHVVLDNSYGKIRRFHDAWTTGSTLTAFAETREEAFEVAGAMLRERH